MKQQIPDLKKHIVIDAETFADKLPREENLRLMHKWVAAATPRMVFECSALTLEGK